MGSWVPVLGVLAVLVGTVGTSVFCWPWIQSESETLRNIGLVAGGFIAVILGAWRSAVAQRQVEVAESGALDQRFRTAAEMLGHEKMAVRISGVIALTDLAVEHPATYLSSVDSIIDEFMHQRQQEDGADHPTHALFFHNKSLSYKGPPDGAVAFHSFYKRLQPAFSTLPEEKRLRRWIARLWTRTSHWWRGR